MKSILNRPLRVESHGNQPQCVAWSHASPVRADMCGFAALLLVCALAHFEALYASDPDAPKPEPDKAEILTDGDKAGQERDDNGLKMRLCWCPPGRFKMGSPETEIGRQNDEAQVDVFLRRGFWLGKYEVTQREFSQLIGKEPWKGHDSVKEGNRFPATYVDWNEAARFSQKLTEQERKSGRLPVGWEYALPTEAQWERACRAGTTTPYSCGDDASALGEHAWVEENTFNAGVRHPHEVGLKKPNDWGLHDMHGNVWEWCRDGDREKLPGGANPLIAEGGSLRMRRGGSWFLAKSYCRSASRSSFSPSGRESDLGFRVALVPSDY